jgi:UDP:flavonoid glycosyltransferase YjiC (YdhE family)
MAADTQAVKPLIVIACPSAFGHTMPLLPHASNLVKQGYDIHFIGGTDFQAAIKKTGAVFYPSENPYTPERFQKLASIPNEEERLLWSLKVLFIDTTPQRMQELAAVLEDLREKHPDRGVILLTETAFLGSLPYRFGAPLPKGYNRFPPVIGVSTVPLLVSSVDTGPFGLGIRPDSSEEGRARQATMYAAMQPKQDELTAHANEVYAKLGSTRKFTETLFDHWMTSYDILLQPCSPSLEYPRSDLSPVIKFIGGTPPKEIDPAMPLPAWWDELVTNKQAASPKKVVFVTQGTVALDYNALVTPTIKALADREDVIVIGVLGVKGAKLDGFEVPSNAKVEDYLMYEAVLQYADVFVTNAGYGGFISGVMHGVPMVFAGRGRKSMLFLT